MKGKQIQMATLHKNPNDPAPERCTDTDRLISGYLERAVRDYYDAEIADDPHFQVWYQLSSLRTGLLSWYSFRKEAAVLEIGAGYGALTGMLCNRCREVHVTERSSFRAAAIAKRWKAKENLHVYAGEWTELEFGCRFDYIILTGILERACGGSSDRKRYAEYLKKAQALLKEDGILLLAVDNRMGLRYFCGAKEPHVNRAFDGIRRYPGGTRGYSFTREELKEILNRAGFAQHKFYYPLPDYKLPQLIYTDDYLPGQNLKERLIPYEVEQTSLIAEEQELYRDVIENQAFPFFANSFLVECGRPESMGAVIYAAVSTDRGKERSYATTIQADGVVKKVSLFPEGRRGAQKLYENIEDLKRHGIPVVEHQLMKDGSLQLPYISWPTLSNAIKDRIRENPSELPELLDRIYAYILQSSEELPAAENALLAGLMEHVKSDDERSRLESLDFGPILKKAYMELIPLNCFYEPESGRFLYFDQEFVREQYPAGYVLFRAIHYIYCFTPGAEQQYPRKQLLERFRLTDVWDIYLAEERRFLDEVRNQEQYRQFYRWARITPDLIQKNIKRLESQAETVADYHIPDKMKKIWNVELAILDEVDRICRKYGLKYFLVHGSLLGAVRHKGFIPWDDDLDLAMPRADYDRFVELAPEELRGDLSLHTPETEPDLFWGAFARIRNGKTTGMEARDLGHRGNLGIWVDLLPLDVCTMDEKKFAYKQKRIRHCQRLLYAKIYGREYDRYADMTPVQWRFYIFLAHLYSHRRLCRMLDAAVRLYTEEPSEDAAFFSGYYKHRRLLASDFQDTVRMEFEHRMVPVPAGYENYMFMSLGKDYLKYPPEEERKPKHRGIFDPEKPYEIYTKLLGDTFEDAKGKQIILFGSGMMFEDYMKKYGDKYHPAFLVDNDENKWGRCRMGLEIRKPEAIHAVPAEKRHLIICSFYYREIAEQLQQMGIPAYKVYVQNPEWIIRTEENS